MESVELSDLRWLIGEQGAVTSPDLERQRTWVWGMALHEIFIQMSPGQDGIVLIPRRTVGRQLHIAGGSAFESREIGKHAQKSGSEATE